MYGLLMIFAFFHELGHLLTGVILGFRPQSLSINPVGLSVSFRIKAEDYNEKVKNGNMLALKQLCIALGGPAVNFILVILFMVFNLKIFNISREFVIYSNILIGLFNLIPIYPLDGGRVLKNLLHILDGLKNSYIYINMISNISVIILTIFSSIIIVYLKNVSIIIILAYLWYLVLNENKMFIQKMKMYRIIERAKENEEQELLQLTSVQQ